MRPELRVLVTLVSALFPVALEADDRKTDNNFNAWFNYFGDHPIGQSKWGAHLEGQWRRHDGALKWQQLLLRPGVNYEVNKLLLLTAGYGYVRAYPYGDFPAVRATNEHRIYQQAWFRYRTGSVLWNSRFRFENRFLGSRNAATGEQTFRYENRFRMLQQARIPITPKTYFTAYDELLLFVKPYVASSIYDQNRAYAAFGVSFNRDWRFEAGYLNQALLQRSGAVLESNHTLMLSIISTARFRRKAANN